MTEEGRKIFGGGRLENIARIAKAVLHELPEKSSLNLRSVCPVSLLWLVCPVCPDCPSCPFWPVCPNLTAKITALQIPTGQLKRNSSKSWLFTYYSWSVDIQKVWWWHSIGQRWYNKGAVYSPAFKNITEKKWTGWKLNKYRQDTYSWGVYVNGIVNVTNNRPEHPSCNRRRSGLIKTGTINCWPRREGKKVFHNPSLWTQVSKKKSLWRSGTICKCNETHTI